MSYPSNRSNRQRQDHPAATPSNRSNSEASSNATWQSLSLGIQPKLAISSPHDPAEQEADRVADQVMNGESLSSIDSIGSNKGTTSTVSRKCAACEEDKQPLIQTKPSSSSISSNQSTSPSAETAVAAATQSNGASLPNDTRSFFESQFGQDFSGVCVHTDGQATDAANDISARAYTYGSDIVFASGEYAPSTSQGKRLLAHELTHVVQQRNSLSGAMIQRDCSDPTFCTAYGSATEIADAKSYLTGYFVPVLEGYFGGDVGDLWKSYLSRRRGDSLTPTVFDTDGNSIHDSFSDNNYIYDETDNVLALIASRLGRGYGNVTQPITNFLSSSEMELDTNFANPFTIPGNIAGGVGSSDAGDDTRRITWGHVSFDITNLLFGKKLVEIEVVLGFEVKDAIDFCPGDCGAVLEQKLATIKMSRLEASGEAYDVPFIVQFTGPHRTKTVID